MVTLKVKEKFKDRVEKVTRYPGDVFEVTDIRANEITDRLPGYVEVISVTANIEKPDLSKLTNQQLVAMCEERGIELPKRYKKADLLALLEG